MMMTMVRMMTVNLISAIIEWANLLPNYEGKELQQILDEKMKDVNNLLYQQVGNIDGVAYFSVFVNFK